ncbi:MAG: hypothetical protein K8I30_23550 [Anaerolineae bacterium]|nr:hypothetical protein [Anaerolineae bacterium]
MNRTLSMVLIAVGIIVAVGAGLWLAVNAANGAETREVVMNAGLAFVPVALLVGAGIYGLTRGAPEAVSDTRRQRDMLDLLKDGQPRPFTELAAVMGIGAGEVRALLNQLIALRIFSGAVNWQAGSVRIIDAAALPAATPCVTCGERLDFMGEERVVCPHCGTEYFLL